MLESQKSLQVGSLIIRISIAASRILVLWACKRFWVAAGCDRLQFWVPFFLFLHFFVGGLTLFCQCHRLARSKEFIHLAAHLPSTFLVDRISRNCVGRSLHFVNKFQEKCSHNYKPEYLGPDAVRRVREQSECQYLGSVLAFYKYLIWSHISGEVE
jgi:hypothetical protein